VTIQHMINSNNEITANTAMDSRGPGSMVEVTGERVNAFP